MTQASCAHCVALECLMTRDPLEKTQLSRSLSDRWFRGELTAFAECEMCAVVDILSPGRPDRPLLVSPAKLAARGLGSLSGRVALLHAVAHIEFNAINLACDAVYRFRGLPGDYYADWIGVAADEARHFLMLRDRLGVLGVAYGELDAHDGLWQMALLTAHDPMARMALVPRVLEARGLDVTPGMIDRLRSVGDIDSAALLEVILAEEVAHVAAGTRWFRYLCALRGLEPESTFFSLVQTHASRAGRGPYNLSHRAEAGFTPTEMAALATL